MFAILIGLTLPLSQIGCAPQSHQESTSCASQFREGYVGPDDALTCALVLDEEFEASQPELPPEKEIKVTDDRTVTTEVDIAGTREQVWKTWMDFDRFPEWNPFFRLIEGSPTVGSPLTEHIFLFGKTVIKLKSIVMNVEPEHLFAWYGYVLSKKLAAGYHSYRIEDASKGHVRFIQEEHFSGASMPVIYPILKKIMLTKFNAMNHALKARVEGKTKLD